jgi:hypothetical protein
VNFSFFRCKEDPPADSGDRPPLLDSPAAGVIRRSITSETGLALGVRDELELLHVQKSAYEQEVVALREQLEAKKSSNLDAAALQRWKD